MSYSIHNFANGATIEAGPFNEMDAQIATLTEQAIANQKVIDKINPDLTTMRELEVDDCFSDVNVDQFIVVTGAIYVNGRPWDLKKFNHVGVKATKIEFKHDFTGYQYNQCIYVGIVVDGKIHVNGDDLEDVFVGFPLYIKKEEYLDKAHGETMDKTDLFTKTFASNGTELGAGANFNRGVIEKGGEEPKENENQGDFMPKDQGTYTIIMEIEGKHFTIKVKNDDITTTTVYQLFVYSDIVIRGFGFLAWAPHEHNQIYDIRIKPIDKTQNEESLGTSISAEYYLKGNASKATRSKPLCIIGAGQSNLYGYTPYNDNEWNDSDNGINIDITQTTIGNQTTYSIDSLNNQHFHYINNNKSSVNFSNNFLLNAMTRSGDNFNATVYWGFDALLCHHLFNNLNSNGNNDLYYIKWAHGGTAIDPSAETATINQGRTPLYWTADYEKLSDIECSLLYNLETEIRNCKAEYGNDYEIGAIIWHQGESDKFAPNAIINYYSNMKKIIAYCRGVVGNARLPFIFGTIPSQSDGYSPEIKNSMEQIAEEDPYVWLVDLSDIGIVEQRFTSGNDSWTEKLHFSTTGNKYAAARYYNCLIDAGVISGTKLDSGEPNTQEEEEEEEET